MICRSPSRRRRSGSAAAASIIPAGRVSDGSLGRLRRFGGILFGDAAVPAPLTICPDRDPAELRRLARRERDGRVSARLLALANALEGMPREEAARLAGMTGQTLGDWVHRYNAEGVEGLRDRHRPPRPALRARRGPAGRTQALVLRGPKLERDGCVAWRARDLCALVEERFGVRYGESGMLKLLKGLDLSWQKARPVHPEADPGAQERFKKPARPDPRGGGPASSRATRRREWRRPSRRSSAWTRGEP